MGLVAAVMVIQFKGVNGELMGVSLNRTRMMCVVGLFCWVFAASESLKMRERPRF